MIGLLFFFVIFIILIKNAIEDEVLRKESRNDAMARGNFDYVDYKGRQWFNDKRARVKIVDGREYLVDLHNPDVVFMDLTAEKEKQNKNSVQAMIEKTREEHKQESIKNCIGSFEYNQFYRIEIPTNRFIKLYGISPNCCSKQYYRYDSRLDIFYDVGEEIKISVEEYSFLTGSTFGYMNQFKASDIEDRKKYAKEHGFAEAMKLNEEATNFSE